MIRAFVDWIFYSLLGLDAGSKIVQSANFFLYDSIKILLLLFIMIAVVGTLRTYIPQKKIRKWLSGKKGIFANSAASFFGAITPFCSCSSIPIFMGFLRSGVPLGAAFSFLITSPIVNEYLVVLMWGFFGWKIALAYAAAGILIGILAGFILGKMDLQKYIVKDFRISAREKEKKYSGFTERLSFGLHESLSILKKLWLWILVGVLVGAFIHNYIPQEFISEHINLSGILAVPLAVIIGVPLYGSCAAIVPIAVALFQKGIALGTALAFMMAVSALSFPEAIMLRRAIKLQLILIFFAVVALSIMFIGYLFNVLQSFLI